MFEITKNSRYVCEKIQNIKDIFELIQGICYNKNCIFLNTILRKSNLCAR